MIFGVPLGTQTIHVDIDLSDIGEFSLAPQDLVRIGLATEAQVSGTRFKSSSNLNELPQIISINRIITVEPLWGQPDVCNIGINRTDFDLSAEANIVIQPTAIFMGSMFSDVDNLALKSNCKPKFKQGELCSLAAGPGEILAIRQTIDNDAQGRPILEVYELEQNGQVIDDNGTWLLDVPMNLDYVTTNEFGERILSNDPNIGIPTKGKYRFKVKWNQSPDLNENVRRAYFLVPNVREYGWNTSNNNDPLQNPTNQTELDLAKKSYAFSLDWDDYADPQTAINCEDTFYIFSYNKVYTVSQLIDQYRGGTLANRILSIKNILDDTCESVNNKFPTNDTIMRFDFIYLLYYIASSAFRPILIALVFVIHYLYFLFNAFRYVLLPALGIWAGVQIVLLSIAAAQGVVNLSFGQWLSQIVGYSLLLVLIVAVEIYLLGFRLKGLSIPLLLYDLCEFCRCNDAEDINDEEAIQEASGILPPSPTAPPNISGIQIVNLGTTVFYTTETDTNQNYGYYNLLSQGEGIIYPPRTPVCYSRVPQYKVGVYTPAASQLCTGNDYTPENSVYFTTSLTLAERINLFNAKAKYFGYPSNVGYTGNPTNPGSGSNRIKVYIEPNLNPISNGHSDNVICMLLTPESLSNLNTGTILTFVNPTISDDINYNQAPLNIYGTNSITGTSEYTATTNGTIIINVPYTDPQNTTSTLSTNYQIPIPNSADTNFHKFPTDIEYFQVITAMTISQFESNQINTTTNPIGSLTYLRNNLWERYINNYMSYNVLYKGRRRYQQDPEFEIPLRGIDNYENQVVVFLVRGVDPYTSRVMTKYGLGRLFGYTNEDAIQITGMTKLNIPIQGGFKNIKHDGITTSTLTDSSYSGMKLYYNTYYYKPSQYTGFSSNNHTYYSSLQSGNIPQSDGFSCTNNECSPNLYLGTNNGVAVRNTNDFTIEFTSFSDGNSNCINGKYAIRTNEMSPLRIRGYFVNELVEGTSLMSTLIDKRPGDSNNDPPNPTWRIRTSNNYTNTNNPAIQESRYLAPKYSSGTTLNYILGSSGRQIIMRSDRLPTSDRLQQNCNNFYSLQQNQNLGIYIIPDEGATPIQQINNFIEVSGDTLPPNFTAQILRTTNSCQESRNLSCYEFVPNPNIPGNPASINPGGGKFILRPSDVCSKARGKVIFDKGCYKIVTRIIKSIPTDISLMTEWLSRTNISFAACRNVFSHLFTNNWVNGTLYAFAFKNNKTFDINGKPIPLYCKNVIYYDEETNNFYYRSSPYRQTQSNSGFVGKKGEYEPVDNNLLYPTTIMDLGPRTDYLQEIAFSDEFDGYVLKNIKTTSYQDVSELLNLLILTRLVNSDFINILIGGDGGSIFNYFNRKPLLSLTQRRAVDADYAQMISINSELGVIPFESENYPNFTGLTSPQYPIDPVYFNSGVNSDVIFGVFYSSDTQIRDYISPKRTIISNDVLPNDNCAFNYFGCFSQEVPLYQWEIKNNLTTSNPDQSIFGSQRNDWYSKPINGSFFFSKKYQDLDRANPNSRYFRTNTSVFAGDYKGYIYSIDTRQQPPNPFYTNPSLNPLMSSWSRNNPTENSVTVGAPFYFYFGLKKGASAFDRFVKKWIRSEIL
jgi:hypothetical protein